MVEFLRKYNHFWVWGGLYLLILLIQAYFTELHPDEAYYWVYSQNIDWGHFHQPPMVALFIKLGYSIFNNELGVRLLSIISHVISLYLIYDLSKGKNPLKFFILILSLFLVHAGSLLAVPDAPLLFFSCLFLWFYHKHYKKFTIKNALILGLIATALLYSKYHGGVFLILLLLSRSEHLKSWQFYIIPAIATLLYIPHIQWQIEHDWISFRFHLFNRELVTYDPVWIIEYILVQIILIGPIFWWAFTRLKSIREENSVSEFKNQMLRLSFFIFAFFLLLSLRNRIEANWIALAYPPLLIGTYSFIEQKLSVKKLLFIGALPLLIFSFARLELMFAFVQDKLDLNFKYQYHEAWASRIQKRAKGKPVIFVNSYQKTSLYMFYAGEKSHCLTLCNYPGNQFDFYKTSYEWDKDSVLIYNDFGKIKGALKNYPNEEYFLDPISDFRSLQSIEISSEIPNEMRIGEELAIQLQIKETGYPQKAKLFKDSAKNEIFIYWVKDPEKMGILPSGSFIDADNPEKTKVISLKTPKEKGNYLLCFGLSLERYFYLRNSYFYRIEIN